MAMMNYALGIFTAFFFYLFIVAVASPSIHPTRCPESRCGSHGPVVRFPFRIKGMQPDYCGYHGFDLSCSERNDTMLELSTSLILSIKNIDYIHQLIDVEGENWFSFSSENQNYDCRLKQVLNITETTSSPFQFMEMGRFSLFGCPNKSMNTDSLWHTCLSGGDGNGVYAVQSFKSLSELLDLVSCTKIHDIVVPVPYAFDGTSFQDDHIVQLGWSNPQPNTMEAQNDAMPKQSEGITKKLRTTGEIFGLIFLVMLIIISPFIYRKNKREREYQSKIGKFLDDYRALRPTRYSYAHIKKITNQFKDEVGQGAYGTVFKGKVANEILVAVKLLKISKGNGEEFINEVGTMGRIHHVNVVRLIGFCADGFRRALVYEYLPNDSLQKFISSPDNKNHFLGWKRLQNIALGIAKGIEYLHQGCEQRILHFDIKPHNILLDDNFNPKVSDFGLAKLCSKDHSAVSMTTARGTIGYIAPEVFSRNFGTVSHKSDVYSFGMVVLEMVGGRKNVDVTEGNAEQIYFPEWIYNLLEEGEDLRFHVEEEGDAEIAKKLAIVGLWCIQWNPVDRPSMKTVVQMLEGDGDNLTTPPSPFSSTGPKKMKARMPGRRLHPDLDVISEIE